MRKEKRPAAGGADRAPERPRERAAASSVGQPCNLWKRCRNCGARVPWWRGLCVTCAGWMRVFTGNRKAYRALSKLDRSGA